MKTPWNHIWMNLAELVSTRSKDPRMKVGAVIVTEDNESVLSIGYNGDEKGGSNKPDSLEPGQSGFIHAEVNAIAKLNYNDQRERKIYITHSPCPTCARLIVNAKISKVIYVHEYRDTKGLDILRDRGIMTEQTESHWE